MKIKMRKKIVVSIGTIFLLFSLICSLVSGAAKPREPTKKLQIYVPCGILIPFREVIKIFHKEYPEIKVDAYYDNAVVLAKLVLKKGKRPDLFVSPGETELGQLRQANLIDEKTIRAFGTYKMVLVTPIDNPGKIKTIKDLTSSRVKTIALADPRFNSVGHYAKVALENLGLWKKIQKKFIFTGDPVQALDYIGTGKAQAGIHYETCPFKTTPFKSPEPVEKYKIIQRIPDKAYPLIKCFIATLNTSKQKQAAAAFTEFILTEPIQRKFRELGLPNLPAVKPSMKPEAKERLIKIEAYYPFNEDHIFIANYLKSLEKKYPGKVKVECIDTRTEKGYDRWIKTGLGCGGVFINGKNAFTVTLKGKKKKVAFLKRLGVYWTEEEFEAALRQEMRTSQK